MLGKYKIAQEIFNGWLGDVKDITKHPGNFDVYLKEKLKPKDELLELYKQLMEFCGTQFYSSNYDKFQEIFKDELNGTKGLGEAIDAFKEIGDEIPKATVFYTLLQIKERLQNDND